MFTRPNLLRSHLEALWNEQRRAAGAEKEPTPAFIGMRTFHDFVAEALGDAEIEHAETVEFGDERWVFALARDKAHLLRLTSEGALEVLFLGQLAGGTYIERIGDEVHLTYKHPGLPGPGLLSVRNSNRERIAPLRETLRRWAETPAATLRPAS